MTDYPQWRKDRCQHCAAGMPMSGLATYAHWNDTPFPGDWLTCTAPTEAEYIAEMETIIRGVGAPSVTEFAKGLQP